MAIVNETGTFFTLLKRVVERSVTCAKEFVSELSKRHDVEIKGRKIFLFEDELSELKNLLSKERFDAIDALLDVFDFYVNVDVVFGDRVFSTLDFVSKNEGDVVGEIKKILSELIETQKTV